MYSFRVAAAAAVFILAIAGIVAGLGLSTVHTATAQADTWCDGAPPVYGSDC